MKRKIHAHSCGKKKDVNFGESLTLKRTRAGTFQGM